MCVQRWHLNVKASTFDNLLTRFCKWIDLSNQTAIYCFLMDKPAMWGDAKTRHFAKVHAWGIYLCPYTIISGGKMGVGQYGYGHRK